jgi:RNA polymerase sigma-70 factor (ECF subfamily)
MDSTSLSLLERLREPDPAAAWNRFVDLYTPLLFSWCRRLGLSEDETGDFVQDVFVILVREMPQFVHDGEHSFRAWLKTVVLNRWRNRRRPPTAVSIATHGEPADASATDLGEEEYLSHLTRRALQIMQSDFQPATWKACWETAVEGRPAADVAVELGLSVGAVYVARSRVLARLREELRGLL